MNALTAAHAERLRLALEACDQIRLTPCRRTVLEFLALHTLPVTIETLQESSALGGAFDSTTIYRALMLFVEAEIVRQFRLRHKLSFFALNLPGTRFEFLICQRCGQIRELPAVPSISAYEEIIRNESGYRMLYHALELYGLCPGCQTVLSNSPRANKLPVSPRLGKVENRPSD